MSEKANFDERVIVWSHLKRMKFLGSGGKKTQLIRGSKFIIQSRNEICFERNAEVAIRMCFQAARALRHKLHFFYF